MENADIARRFDELAQLLEARKANPHRIRAYRRAASILQRMEQPVSDLVAQGGVDTLRAIRGIGPRLAGAIVAAVKTGRLPMLDRLRRELEPVSILQTVPGIGPITAARCAELGIDSLEELETAAHDGRLANVLNLPLKTIQGVMDSLAARLARLRDQPAEPVLPPVAELLDVDREYREGARAGILRTIAPRRFNPTGLKWLPILRTRRGARHYTALFSNTARAHQLERTGDWVVLYHEGGQVTVVTEYEGPLKGRRVVRGAEDECFDHYMTSPSETPPLRVHSSGKR